MRVKMRQTRESLSVMKTPGPTPGLRRSLIHPGRPKSLSSVATADSDVDMLD